MSNQRQTLIADNAVQGDFETKLIFAMYEFE